MTDAIIITIILILTAVGVRRVYRTVRYGGSCCGTGTATDKKVKVKDRNKSHYSHSYKLTVEGMVCSGCAVKVENALNSEEGLWAKVDLGRKEVNVLSKKEMTREDFKEVLKKTPYTLMDLK